MNLEKQSPLERRELAAEMFGACQAAPVVVIFKGLSGWSGRGLARKADIVRLS
jgi:hypothetical protein